jgi:hypothetical protein
MNLSAPFSSPALITLKIKVLEWFKGLNTRERLIVALAPLLVLAFVIPQIVGKINTSFARQTRFIGDAERDRKQVLQLLGRYASLKAKREAVQQQYKAVEMKDNVLSHLETLLKSKAGISTTTPGVTLKELPAIKVGTNYEQIPYSIRFPINNMSALVTFLEALVGGDQPLVLKKLEFRKSAPDNLTIDLEVVNIRELES